jgi:hypothetical protein
VILAVGHVREHLAPHDHPLHRYAVDDVFAGEARRAAFERQAVVLPERCQLFVLRVPLVDLFVLDDASEPRNAVDEIPLRVVPDLALAVRGRSLARLEVNHCSAPLASENDVEDLAVPRGRERAVEKPRGPIRTPWGNRNPRRDRDDGADDRQPRHGPTHARRPSVADDRVPLRQPLRFRRQPVEVFPHVH